MAISEGDTNQQRERPAGLVGSVANALDLLQILHGGGEIQVNRASRALGISRSTVHRLLNTLAVYGYVEQDPVTRSYLPGPALMDLGLAALQSNNLRPVARDALARLAAVTRETTHLMVLRGDEVLCIDSIESNQTVRTGSRVGWVLPARATASGKALLADLTDAELREIFPWDAVAGPVSSRGNEDADLLAELELVRARGYATNVGESEPDISAVAVVLRGRSGRARAALSVTAPRTRGDDAWMREAGRQAVAIAESVRGAVV